MTRLLTFLFAFLFSGVVWAQQTPNAINGCVYLSATQTLTDGQQSRFLCDVNGKLVTSGSGGGGGGVVQIDQTGTNNGVQVVQPLPAGTNAIGAITNTSFAVTGTFWQATQPVSGTFWQATQPISASSLPLPTLAATSTKQSDGSQKTQIVDGSGNVIAATANALNVNCSAGCGGGYDSGPVPTNNTPSNTLHAIGSSEGGLFTLAVARTSGGSGSLSSILVKDTNNVAQTFVLRVWSRNPASTTCTDGSAFVSNATDDQYLMGSGPTAITTAPSVVTTGDANVYASLTGITWDYQTNSNANIYACLINGVAITPAASKPIYVIASGPQN